MTTTNASAATLPTIDDLAPVRNIIDAETWSATVAQANEAASRLIRLFRMGAERPDTTGMNDGYKQRARQAAALAYTDAKLAAVAPLESLRDSLVGFSLPNGEEAVETFNRNRVPGTVNGQKGSTYFSIMYAAKVVKNKTASQVEKDIVEAYGGKIKQA